MASIRDLRHCAAGHVAHFTDPSGNRGFHTYDWLGDPATLTPLDCLAPALLSVPIGYRQVVPLFRPDGPGAKVREAMQAVLDDHGCAVADFLDIDLNDSVGPWALVEAAILSTGPNGTSAPVPDFKAVAVTKILHRKRPNLVPIFDSQIYRFYVGQAPPYGAYDETPKKLWPRLQADLQANRRWVARLAAGFRTPDDRPLSILRAADITIWEHRVTGCLGERLA
jgi:hypothetical protein